MSSSSPSPVRVPPHAVLPPRGPTSISPPTVTSQQKNGDIASRKLRWSGTGNGALDALEQEIVSAINDLRSDDRASDEMPVDDDVLLVVDQPDLLLAATGPGMGVGAVEMGEFLLGLRQVR